jgi:hypothetical protein
MFNLLVWGNGDWWETPPFSSGVDRFKEYSGSEAEAIDAARPETLRPLEEIPTLLMYEVGAGAPHARIVRHGRLRNIVRRGRELVFTFEPDPARAYSDRALVLALATQLGIDAAPDSLGDQGRGLAVRTPRTATGSASRERCVSSLASMSRQSVKAKGVSVSVAALPWFTAEAGFYRFLGDPPRLAHVSRQQGAGASERLGPAPAQTLGRSFYAGILPPGTRHVHNPRPLTEHTLSKSIFISHAVKDKTLVEEIVELIEEGIGVPETEIFCSSLQGYGIPAGQNFVTFIKDQLIEPKIVVLILTPAYFES